MHNLLGLQIQREVAADLLSKAEEGRATALDFYSSNHTLTVNPTATGTSISISGPVPIQGACMHTWNYVWKLNPVPQQRFRFHA